MEPGSESVACVTAVRRLKAESERQKEKKKES